MEYSEVSEEDILKLIIRNIYWMICEENDLSHTYSSLSPKTILTHQCSFQLIVMTVKYSRCRK